MKSAQRKEVMRRLKALADLAELRGDTPMVQQYREMWRELATDKELEREFTNKRKEAEEY